MIYIQNIGLKSNKDAPSENNITPVKMQQRRQAFNEMSCTIYQKLNQTQTTMSSTKKSNSFNATNRLNQSFNSYAQSKAHSPRRLSVHRSSLTPAQLLKQANDQFSVKKNQKNGVAFRLSQLNFSQKKNDQNLMHIDQLLDSYRKSPSRKNELKQFGETQDNFRTQYSSSFYTQSDQNTQFTNENIDIGFTNSKINEKIQQFNSSQINFIKPNTISVNKMLYKGDNRSNKNSLQTNLPDSIENANIKIPQMNKSNDNMNKFLNEVDPSIAFNSQNEFSIQHSRASTFNARRENSISGYAIFKSTDTPLNPSFSHMEDDLSKPSFSTTSNHFRIKRNNPFKRFYKTEEKINENNLYRYIDTQNENCPTKLSQGAFQRIVERSDNNSQFNSKLSDDINILQYYNPIKNNMQNLVDAEGKVFKKHYILSLQCRLDHLKKQKIQNEAQMMLINYNLVNEIEQTSKLIYKQLPEELANQVCSIVDQVKQNIYQNAQTQKQNYMNEIEQKRKRSQSQASYQSEEQSQLQQGDEQVEEPGIIYKKIPTGK